MGREPKLRPHPAIFRIDAVVDLCPICGERKELVYVDRELGEAFCRGCLEYVVTADLCLSDMCERPVPVL